MKFALFSILVFCAGAGFAQDDLLNQLKADQKPANDYVLGTFSGTRIVNGQSIETKHKNELEVIISHRFGTLNSGGYNLFGLDIATIRLGLEYGITDNLGVSIGRSSATKTYDGYLKYKLLRQQPGTMPVSVAFLGGLAYRSAREDSPGYSASDRTSFTAEAMIARKFNSTFSFQLTPVWVHKNRLFPLTDDAYDVFAVGLGARVKVTRSLAVNAEYYPRLNDAGINYDAIGIGLEIETGGHVFDLVFTNSEGMTDRRYVTETDGNFFDGDIHFGFNLTRTFQLGGRRKNE